MERLLRWAGVAALVALPVALLVGANRPATLRAEQFVLVDAQGRVRATLGFDEADQPALQLYTEQGLALARLGLAETQDGAVLGLSSEGAAGPWLSLGVLGDEPRLLLYGGGEWPHGLTLSVAEGRPALALHDESGAQRATLTLREDEAGMYFSPPPAPEPRP